MERTNPSYAYFGGGCFWCTEAVFKMVRGVLGITSGYAGGTTENPTYEEVCTGETGHAEVIRVEYDPGKVNYHDLLTVFFASHDPSTLNRQGNDIGTQYRSIILYSTPEEQKEAEAFIEELNSTHPESDPVVTEVAPFTDFYPAEAEHTDYYARHKSAPYCMLVINPKLEHVQEALPGLLA